MARETIREPIRVTNRATLRGALHSMGPTLAATLAGACLTLPLLHTAWWPLAPLAVATLVALLQRSTPGHAAWLGWVFGSAWMVACTWWLFISMHRYGGLPAPLAGAAVLALGAALAGWLALACWAWTHWARSNSPAWATLGFAALWLLAEWARGRVFTGFPWGASGYTQVDGPLRALAPWVGVYGMGALVAAVGAWTALWHQSLVWRLAPAVALLSVAVLTPWAPSSWGAFTTSSGSVSVSLIQTNVSQEEKFDVQRVPLHLRDLLEAVQSARGQLVVAPETAIPLLPADLGDAGLAAFAAPFNAQRGALLGLPLGDYHRGYTNSVYGFGGSTPAGATPYRYDKHHLVPFGEFIPPGFRWFVDMMNMPLGDFARGPVVAPSFNVAGQRVAPNICYEDVFGEELALRFAKPDEAPTVLANVSNIGWFGNTMAIDHHLHMSRLRSLELQRPMIRATNTGATVVIDHQGQVLAALPRWQRGVLESTVEGREGLTPFARWVSAAGGLWPLVLGALLTLVWVSRRSR